MDISELEKTRNIKLGWMFLCNLFFTSYFLQLHKDKVSINEAGAAAAQPIRT